MNIVCNLSPRLSSVSVDFTALRRGVSLVGGFAVGSKGDASVAIQQSRISESRLHCWGAGGFLHWGREEKMSLLSGLFRSTRRLARLFLSFGMLLFALSAQAVNPPPYPVIFVHGLIGSGADFQSMIGSLDPTGVLTGGRLQAWKTPSGPLSCNWTDSWANHPPLLSWTQASGVGIPASKRYFAIDFSSYNDLTFNEQGGELKQVIDCVKAITSTPRAPTTKVILVAHSMGGLAARAYLQGVAMSAAGVTKPYGGDIAKLITVGTPHQGSPWPANCQSSWGTPLICSLLGNPASVAMYSLRPESTQLSMLNDWGASNYKRTIT